MCVIGVNSVWAGDSAVAFAWSVVSVCLTNLSSMEASYLIRIRYVNDSQKFRIALNYPQAKRYKPEPLAHKRLIPLSEFLAANYKFGPAPRVYLLKDESGAN